MLRLYSNSLVRVSHENSTLAQFSKYTSDFKNINFNKLMLIQVENLTALQIIQT